MRQRQHQTSTPSYLKLCSHDDVCELIAKIMRTKCPHGKPAEWCAEHCIKPNQALGKYGCIVNRDPDVD